MAFLSPPRGSAGAGPGFPPLKRGAKVDRPSGDWRGRRGGYSRETNPILGRCPMGRGQRAEKRQSRAPVAGADYAKQTQFPAVPGGTRPQRLGTRGKRARRTQFAPAQRNRWGKPRPQTRFVAFGSPIHPTRGHNCAKQTQFSPAGKQAGSFRGEQCKTNPICRSCQQSVVGRLCKTNPIPGGPRYPSIPLCHHSNIDAAPSVLCETKPIPPDRQDGQVLGGKGVMANLTCKRPPQNKANSHIGRTGPRPEMPPPAGTSVRNKANWPRTDWKRRWAGAGNAADDAASVRNKANSRPGPTRGIWNMSLRAERGICRRMPAAPGAVRGIVFLLHVAVAEAKMPTVHDYHSSEGQLAAVRSGRWKLASVPRWDYSTWNPTRKSPGPSAIPPSSASSAARPSCSRKR